MRALVTGGTGFIGSRLVRALSRPVVLSRDPERAARALGDVEAHRWDPGVGPPAPEALAGIDAVFHLAGETVAGRWTAARKRRIRESRVAGTRALVAGLRALDRRPRVLVSASAVGYYGARGDEELDEASPPGEGFLAEVCRAWEEEALAARELGVRVVTPRIGVVLGPGGGALARMLRPFRMGLGGRLGSGTQWMPWIHLDDVVGLLLHAAANDEVSGPLNAVAPAPATNRAFTRALGAALGRPAFIPAPGFALKLVLGEFAEALLGSQRVVPRVAERTGYRFRHPELAEALRDALGLAPATGAAAAP